MIAAAKRLMPTRSVKVFLKIRYPKIIDELYGGKITVVQLVLTIPIPIDFVRNYDKIGI